MTVNYTTNLALGQPVTGTESGTWGDDVNNSVTSYLDIAIAGGLAITVTTADVTLTLTQGTSSATNIGSTTAQYAILNVSGAMTAARNLILPSSSRQYVINNNTTGGFALTVKGSATSGVTMVNGESAHIYWNGSDYAKLSNAQGGAGSFTNLAYTGTLTGSTGVIAIGTNQIYKDSSGNVGIGTSSPSYKLDVSMALGTAVSTGLRLTNTNTNGYGAGLRFDVSPTVAGQYSGGFINVENSSGTSTDGGRLKFYTAAEDVSHTLTERMRIDSSGNVGIGTSSPNTRLQVYKAATSAFTGTSPGALLLTDSTNTLNYFTSIDFNTTNAPSVPYARIGMSYTSGGSTLSFGTSNVYASGITNTAMTIDPTGIITMSAYGVGTATFSAAGVISSVSDETWKIKDGIPVDPDAMLKKLEPGYWYYNDEKKEIFGVDRQLGFYAQNVNAAIGPEAAPTPEEGKPWGYYDRSVLAVTVMSLQKALATIESLTARITALESA